MPTGVYVGGISMMTLTDIVATFSQFGEIRNIVLPEKLKQTALVNRDTYPYAMIVYEKCESIDNLRKRLTIGRCGRSFIDVMNHNGGKVKVEIGLWEISSLFYGPLPCEENYPFDAFISKMKPGPIASKVAYYLKCHFGEVFHLRLFNCPLGYPNGMARVRFCAQSSFENAISLGEAFVLNKKCSIKPFIERRKKCTCEGKANAFCLHCKKYLCKGCYDSHHSNHDEDFRAGVKQRYQDLIASELRNRAEGELQNKTEADAQECSELPTFN